VLAVAHQFALEQRSPGIEPEHLLRGLASLDLGVGRSVLANLGIDLFKLLPEIVELLPRRSDIPLPERDLSASGNAVLAAARRAASELGHRYVGSEHVMLGLIAHPSSASAFLVQRGASYDGAINGVKQLLGEAV
jgi:ATP-dependent Clp protease ATP-binding subunit ClpC